MITVSDGAEIYWEQQGAGPPLLLLHGNGEDGGIFKALLPALTQARSVITIDSRGHGRSTAGGKALSLCDMAEDVLAVMDDAGLDSADILGFSDGGNIGLIFAVRHPERLRSLIISGANSVPQGMRLKYQALLWLEHFLVSIGTAFSPRLCRKKELLDLMLYEPQLKTPELEKITAPTLITAGERDMIRSSHTDYLAAIIKNSEKHIFTGGHFTLTEQPEEFCRTILNFLNRH